MFQFNCKGKRVYSIEPLIFLKLYRYVNISIFAHANNRNDHNLFFAGIYVHQWTQELQEFAEMCAFEDVKNENIRDRLVIGILDMDLSQKCQMMSDLTLQKACSVNE